MDPTLSRVQQAQLRQNLNSFAQNAARTLREDGNSLRDVIDAVRESAAKAQSDVQRVVVIVIISLIALIVILIIAVVYLDGIRKSLESIDKNINNSTNL